MKRKLSAKIQKLNPPQIEKTKTFSQSIIIEPETRKLSLQKGTIYAVYDISGDLEIEVNVMSKIVHDILHDLYYQSEGVSPTQTLEKTILEIKNKIKQMDEKGNIQFNIVASALWGNVLYTVQFGSGKSYIVQEGEIRSISTKSEGNFSAASGVVNNDDVVILSTEAFDNEYPPKKLLAASIAEGNLQPQQAALLMKFVVDTEFSENEIVDFGLGEDKKENKVAAKLTGLIKKMRTAIKKRRLEKSPRPKVSKKVMFILIGVFIFIPILAYLLKSKDEETEKAPKEQEQLLGADVTRELDSWDEEKSKDAENKVMRVNPEAFYDIQIIDDAAKPTEIEIIESKIIVAAKESGKVFISEMESPDFEKIGLEFPGINSLNNSKGILSFSDKEGFKYLDTDTKEIDETYEVSDLTLTDTYLDFIYAISGTQIIKYTKENGQLTPEVWGEDEDFSNAVSMSVSYSIFVTTNDGKILRYTAGEKDAFTPEDLATPLGKNTKVFVDTVLNDIYIADPDNKRIVIFNDSGELIKQYKTEKEDTWNNIKDIAITDDEKYIYILNGTKVYVIGLDVEEEIEEEATEPVEEEVIVEAEDNPEPVENTE